jgi:predicted DNA-binding transcriptional regulator AlpA
MTTVATSTNDTHHLVTVSLLEAGRLLGLNRTAAYRHAREDTFPVPVREIAGRKRVRLIDIENYLDATFG